MEQQVEIYKNYTIHWGYEPSALNPREDFYNLGVLMLANSWMNETDKEITAQARLGKNVEKLLKEKYGEIAVVLPVYKYEHGNIYYQTTPFNIPFDSCHTGYIWCTKKDAKIYLGVKRITKNILKKIVEILNEELSILSSWINGEVYGYDIENPDSDIVDACGGYYDFSYMMNEARHFIDRDVEYINNKPETRASIIKMLD